MGGGGVGKRRGRGGEAEGVDSESLDAGDGELMTFFPLVRGFPGEGGDGC